MQVKHLLMNLFFMDRLRIKMSMDGRGRWIAALLVLFQPQYCGCCNLGNIVRIAHVIMVVLTELPNED